MSKKLEAAGQIGLGVFKVGGGLLAATGHGLIGAWARKHHHMATAVRYGTENVKAGTKDIKAGIDQWKNANT